MSKTASLLLWKLPQLFRRAKHDDADLLSEIQSSDQVFLSLTMKVAGTPLRMLAPEVVRSLQVIALFMLTRTPKFAQVS